MTMDRIEAWRQMEEALSTLVNSMSSQLSQRDRENVTELLDHSEYGVALELLHSIIFEWDIQLSANQRREMQRLAKLMDIELP
jgi:hypothetical protein